MPKLTLRQNDANREHNLAVVFPKPCERPVLYMLQAWELFVVDYRKRFDTPLIATPSLCKAWQGIGKALLTLARKGEVGRLNREHLCKFIKELAEEEGVKL